MSIVYWTTLAIVIAFSGVSLACALGTLDGGGSASKPKTVIAAKSDRLARVVQPAYRYKTIESPVLGGSRLSLVVIKETAQDNSRAD